MNKTVLIVIGIIAVVIGLAYWKKDWIMKRMGIVKPDEFIPQDNNESNSLPKSTYTECSQPPLKKGCKGNYVLMVQKVLNKLYGSGLTEDGKFGSKTEQALIANGYGSTVEIEDIQKMTQELRERNS